MNSSKRFLRAALVGVAALAVSLPLVGSVANASTPTIRPVTDADHTRPVADNPTRTIQWVDTTTGKVTRTWHGSKDAAETIHKQQMAAIEKERAKVVTPQIIRVEHGECKRRTDFFTLWNEGKLCFSWAGSMNVQIWSVYRVDSGNNAGEVDYWGNCIPNPCHYRQTVGRWSTIYLTGGGTPRWVNRVQIY